MSDIILKMKDWWESLPADRKTNFKKGVIVLLMVAIFYGVYVSRESANTEAEKAAIQLKKEVDIIGDTSIFEDDLRAEARGIVKETEQDLKNQKDTIAQMQQMIQDLQGHQDRERLLPDVANDELTRSTDSPPKFPPAVNSNYGIANDADLPSDVINAEVKTIGGLGKASGTPYVDSNAKKKTGLGSFYLATGFMKARLLEGLEIASTQSARSNPAASLFMVQKPAVLPNDVKANLSGCFIVGSATGHLNKERIDFRTVSLNCVDHKNNTIIDTKIEGHVNDIDGKQGISARVVTRVGATIGRAFAADFVGGIGKGYAAANQTTSVQTISGGVLSNPPSSAQISRSALGSGIEASTETLKNFYQEIIDQTSPTLESGAGRDVTIVITKGTWLDLTNMNK